MAYSTESRSPDKQPRSRPWELGLATPMSIPAPQALRELRRKFVSRALSRRWRLTEAHYSALRQTPRESGEWPNRVLVPDVWLGSLSQTFEELWQWVADVHPGAARDATVRSQCMRLAFAHQHYGRDEPSLGWGLLDLNPDMGGPERYRRSATEVRGEYAAGLSVLTALALYPDFPRNYPVRLPGIVLTGTGLSVEAVPAFILSAELGQLSLGYMSAGLPDARYVLPTFTRLGL